MDLSPQLACMAMFTWTCIATHLPCHVVPPLLTLCGLCVHAVQRVGSPASRLVEGPQHWTEEKWKERILDVKHGYVGGINTSKRMLNPHGSAVYVLAPEEMAVGERPPGSKAVLQCCPEIVQGMAIS